MTKHSKKTAPTREELLEQIRAFDTDAEITKLTAEVERLTSENAAFLTQRNDLSRELTTLRKDMATIRDVVRIADIKTRTYGPDRSGADRETGAIASRLSMANVQAGIANGTHDPATGLEYTSETQPIRDLTAGARAISKAELSKVFPELEGPTVEVSEVEEAHALEAMTALQIGNPSVLPTLAD